MEQNIKNRLRDLRVEHRLSQEELAEKLGISRQSVIALEQGKSMPSLPLVVEMCNFFNSAFEEMFEFEREINEMFESGPKIVVASRRHPRPPSGPRLGPAETGDRGSTNRENLLADSRIHGNDRKNSEEQFNKISETSGLNHELKNNSSAVSDGANMERNMPGFMKPWEPFREVSLRDAMDRLLEDSVVTGSRGMGMPKIDVKETKDNVVVKAELPGVAEEDITVEVSDGVMTISGQKMAEKEEEKEGYYYKESFSGSFSRSISLPSEVKAEKTEAEMDNGVLTVTVPKVEAKKPHKVAVKKKAKIEKK